MKLTINRKELLEALKTMLRVVPNKSPVKELEGFLLECDEDAGELVITATNFEASIQRKLKVSVESLGSFVIDAKLLTNIITLLSGDEVVFSSEDAGRIIITGGSATYEIPVLLSKNYPKPEIPFPDDTIKVSGICDIYLKTANTVSSNESKPALGGVNLEIFSDSVRAVGCDGMRIATVKKPSESGGMMSFIMPKESLSYLANAVKNSDVLDVGICDNSVVFMKQGMMFSSRIIPEKYIDTDMLISNVTADYVAKVDGTQLYNAIDMICVVAKQSSDSPKLNLRFGDNEIALSIVGDKSTSNTSIPANISKPTSKEGFYYNPFYFADCFKTVNGEIELVLSSKGLLLLKDSVSQYMMICTRPPQTKQKAA